MLYASDRGGEAPPGNRRRMKRWRVRRKWSQKPQRKTQEEGRRVDERGGVREARVVVVAVMVVAGVEAEEEKAAFQGF